MNRLLLAACAAAAALPGHAQVVITEVHPGEGWIELQNRGPGAELLDHWSVLCTTPTPGRPNEYWWALPIGTTLAPGAFMRVHWFAPYRVPTADEAWTGTGIADFLFGLGGEPLDPAVGSVALLDTSEGAHMGTAAHYLDWITWGQAGRPRELYAVQAGRWLPGEAAPAPGPTASLALADDPAAEPTPASGFFVDATPSPLAPNQLGAAVEHYGTDCAVGVANAPALEVAGIPAVGNADFGVRVVGTYPQLGQSVVVFIGFARGVGIVLPIREFTCPLWIDGGGIPPWVVVLPATPGRAHTDLPLSLAGAGPEIAGLTLYVQAITGRLPLTPFDHAASGGVAITIGG